MKRIRDLHPAWIAAGIAVAVVIWLASGLFGGGQQQPGKQDSGQQAESGPVKVRVRESQAEQITREAVVSGRTAPVRSVTVRAETAGRIAEIEAERGAKIAAGDVLVRLAVDDRRARLDQAQAVREQRRLQYQAARRMQEKGYQTKVDLAQAQANLKSAQAQVEQMQQDLNHTVIRAPFAGVLETRPVEEGDFVGTGDTIGRIIDQDPFIVRGDVSEDVIGYLESGQPGSAELADGSVKQGHVRYLASEADDETRTYRVELEVPNPEGRFISGASADMHLPLEEVMAHAVEPAILTLNADGEFGIDSVDDDNVVQFHKADIVRNRGGKVWLAGLPETLRIITVGQGFVTDGDAVDPTTKDVEIQGGAKHGNSGVQDRKIPKARP